jgi:hypothetical protein
MKNYINLTLTILLVVLFIPIVSKADILVATGTDIKKLKADGTGAATFISSASKGLAYDSTSEKLFYVGASSGSIMRADRSGANPTTLVSGAGSGIVDLVIDRVSSPPKIIWGDVGNAKIRRSNLDGTSVEDLVTGASQVIGLAIDSSASKLYWTDFSGISRSNLNGGSPEYTHIADSSAPSFVMVHSGKVYWSNANDNIIKRANTDGTSIETIQTGATGAQGLAYDSTLAKLFFIGQPSGGVGLRKMDLSGSNLATLGSQNGYDLVVDFTDGVPTPTPTPTLTPTVTQTSTPTKTPTPVPTAIPTLTSLPDSLCMSNQAGYVISEILGTYTLKSKNDKDGSFTYTQSNGSNKITGIFKVKSELSSSISTKGDTYDYTIALFFANQAPIGLYTGEIDEKKLDVSIYNRAIPGPCPLVTPTPVPTNGVGGAVKLPGTDGTQKTLATAGNIYALLFEGTSPSNDKSTLPSKGVLVDGSGNYLFENVIPGDYHIRFYADDVKFSSDYVAVSAIEEGLTTVPDVTARVVTYNETGCTKKDLASVVYNSGDAVRKLDKELLAQISAIETLGYAKLKGKKLSSFVKQIAKFRTRSSGYRDSGLATINDFPLVTRSKCPTANACTTTKLAKPIKSIKKSIENFNSLSDAISRYSATAINTKKTTSTNSKYRKSVKKLYKAALKNIAQLPKENETCPEV